LPNRERETKILHGELFSTDRETLKDVIKRDITTSNGDDGALFEVGTKIGDLAKRMKDANKVANIFSNGSKENGRIVGVWGGAQNGALAPDFMKEAMRGGEVKHLL
jgi:hypothetical protein